jgi:hypothetical protein
MMPKTPALLFTHASLCGQIEELAIFSIIPKELLASYGK